MSYLLIVAALIAIADILICLRRGYMRSTVRVVTQVISFLAAFFLAKPISRKVIDVLMSKAQENLNMGSDIDIASLLESGGSVTDMLLSLVSLMIAPLVFFLLYILLKFITLFVYWIFCAIFRIKRTKGKILSLPMSLVVGVISALIGIFAISVPVLGYVSLADTVMENVNITDESMQEIRETQITPLKETPVLSGLHKALGSKIFTGLTQTKLENGQTLGLEKEMVSVLSLVNDITVFTSKPLNTFTEDDAAKLVEMANIIDESPLLSELTAFLLRTVGTSFMEGEGALGMSLPESDANVQVIMNSILEIFASTTSDVVGTDLRCLAEVFGEIAKAGAFRYLSADAADGDFVRVMMESGVIARINAILQSNPRLKPLPDAIISLALRSVMGQLGGDLDDYREEHAELLNQVADAIRESAANGTVDEDVLDAMLDSVLEEHDIEINDATREMVTQGVADFFAEEDVRSMTNDEIIDRLLERFGSAASAAAMSEMSGMIE